MKTFRIFLLLSLNIIALAVASADNIQAKDCQIFISKIRSSPSSHGVRNIQFVLKVGLNHFLPGEAISRVGYYGYSTEIDRGNAEVCSRRSDRETSPSVHEIRGHGEYFVNMTVDTGSIGNPCNGYDISTRAAFFVETTYQNTYWINPDLDPGKFFFFDETGFRNLLQQAGGSGNYGLMNTADNDGLRYYNPKSCR